MDAGGENVRRSTRDNKGIPPARLGVAATGKPKVILAESRRSFGKQTTSSDRRMKTVELERDREIQQLRERLEEKRMELANAERAHRTTTIRLELLRDDPEQSEETKAEVKSLRFVAADKQVEVEFLKTELESLERRAAAEEKVINSKFDLDQEIIRDEGEEDGDSELDEFEKQTRIERWAHEQDAILKKDSEVQPSTPLTLARVTVDATHSTVVGHQNQIDDNYDADKPYYDEKGAHVYPVNFTRQKVPRKIEFEKPPRDTDPPPTFPRPTLNYEQQQEQNDNPVMNETTAPVNLSSNDDVITQLVTALTRSFGRQAPERDVILKTTVDKDLPSFTGNPADWENFKCEYERTTKKYKFEDSENLTRLRKALKGEAMEAVKHLLANCININKIWDVLQKRFGRPEFVLDYLIEKAKAAKSPDVSKPETLIEFGTAIEALVTNIAAYNEDDYMTNRQIVTEFVGKLPALLRTQWYEWLEDNSTRKPNLKFFSRWLEKKVDAAILAVKPKLEPIDEEKKSRSKRGSAAVNATSTEDSKSSNNQCPACGKKHSLNKCWSFPKMTSQERWDIAKTNMLCLCCLKTGHRAADCSVKKECEEEGCDRSHHQLLHYEPKKKSEKVVNLDNSSGNKRRNSDLNAVLPVSDAAPTVANSSSGGSMNAAIVEGCDGPLPILPVKIRGPAGVRRTYALLDCGASASLICKQLANEIGLNGELHEYTFTGINGQPQHVSNAQKVNCEVSGGFRSAKFHGLNSAMTVDDLKLKPYSINMDEIRKKWPHLKRIQGANLVKVVPELIIGNNNPNLILCRQIVGGGAKDPVAWRSKLGWTVSGIFDGGGHGTMNTIYGEMSSDDYLHHLIKESFSTENFGVMVPREKGVNLEEKKSFAILEATTKKVGNRFETGLLWKDDDVDFPESERAAFFRLLTAEKKMRKDANFKKLYLDKFEEYRHKDYIRKLTEDEVKVNDGNVWYIPHFGVTSIHKPGKLRLVFDAAAKSNGVCLNDKLMKGPDLIRPLTSVLWNFRRHRIAITGDISDMFHRVLIRNEDQPSQRFLWRDGDCSRAPDHYQMNVLIFGASSSPSSAIFVKNKNAEMHADKFPLASDVIVNDFYVDDCLSGAKTVPEAIQLRKEICDINEAGGLSVCKWMSNNSEVLSSIPEDLRASGVKDLEEKTALPTERVLGLWWDPNEDVFTFTLNMQRVPAEIVNGKRPTKREMCSLVMSVFDPIGFVSHFKVKGLLLLQQTWRCGIGWDDEIPTNIYDDWLTWIDLLHEIPTVKVPRWYSCDDDVDNAQLHVFVDASEEAYCAAVYLRVEKNGYVDVSFISSKVKVAPMKKLTIPRLELQAAVLGSRLANTIQGELRLKIHSCMFWSDSATVLSWIRSDAVKFKEFVANRIGEIQETTDIRNWRWIPTALNVADVATRFSSKISFDNDSCWFTGPTFLTHGVESWPVERRVEQKESVIASIRLELLGDESDVGQSSDWCRQGSGGILPRIECFSSFTRLLRATAAAIRAAKYWLWKVHGSRLGVMIMQVPWTKVIKSDGDIRYNCELQSHLTAVDIIKAEKALVQHVQHESFGEELKCLLAGETCSIKSKIYKLSPVLRNGLLTVSGRIAAAKDVDEDSKWPLILPPKHHFTELLIDHEHRMNVHQGRETVLSNLRRKYWIIDARQAVKRSWNRCQVCNLKKAKPIVPEMGDLPHYRLESGRLPFTFTGVDFFGPLEVTVGRRHEKRWGALFCCMVTRAVHLEVAHSLSTDEMMMVLSRFVDARGRPRLIVSDNGTNFVGAASQMKKEMEKVNFEVILGCSKFYTIEWRFNPPGSPHMGGVWERLVQTVKKCLFSILNEKYPRDSTLLTVLKAVENIVNSRPLTYVSDDPTDPHPLTANDLLRGGTDSGPAILAEVEGNDEYLRFQWRRAQLFADRFWTRWTSEYLPKLIKREKWHQPAEPLQVGDLVFMVDDNLPRNVWLRGYISATFPGKDGQVRVVEVTTSDKNGKKAKYRRSAVKVCPLGLRMEIKEESSS
ncbi:unnamed protein product [Orchesella dallaii]|uniref:Integrase catalytic domain-containing protein n=1 Tax=Orchesella dallaii TaxID=48710 RepID=A0ABP1RX57_9HEXA